MATYLIYTAHCQRFHDKRLSAYPFIILPGQVKCDLGVYRTIQPPQRAFLDASALSQTR